MTPDEELIAALDSLRSQAELALPEFAELARHLEQHPQFAAKLDDALEFDQRMGAALHEVSVPPGLAEQLLARLAQAEADASASRPSAASLAGTLDRAVAEGQSAPETAAIASPAADEFSESTPGEAARPTGDSPFSRLRLSRRRVLILTGIVAASAATIWVIRPIGRFDRDSIALEANSAFRDLDKVAGPAQPLANADRVAGYPYSEQLARFGDIRWRPVERFLGRHGVAFELRSPAGVRGTLFVVKLLGGARAPIIGSASIPHRPALHNAGSGGLTTAIWQEHGHLFVLVVDGDQRAYRHFLPTAATVT
ncbi:MAG: hypothetical protein AB7U73_00945 [Pirellulales bacterium]